MPSFLETFDRVLADADNRRTLWISGGRIGVIVEEPTEDRLAAVRRYKARQAARLAGDSNIMRAFRGADLEDGGAQVTADRVSALQGVDTDVLADLLESGTGGMDRLYLKAHIVGFETWVPTDEAKRDAELSDMVDDILNRPKLRDELEQKMKEEAETITSPLPESSDASPMELPETSSHAQQDAEEAVA